MTFLNLPGLTPEETSRLVPHRPILVTYRGSHAHGMYVPPTEPTGIDDIDLLGVYIAPLSTYFGRHLDPPRGGDVKIREWDSANYELRHFVGLMCKGNPNVLSTLWTTQRILCAREGEMLVEARKLFATKQAYHSFGGYAYSQLKRMEAFREPGEASGSSCGCKGEFHGEGCAVSQERGRGSSKRFATGFMGEKRKALVEKFGYDVKNAAHLIRLLRMGIEFLKTGELVVDRREAGDAEELLSIKKGGWTLGAVKSHADLLFAEMKRVNLKSTLPEEPDYRAVDLLLKDVLCYALGAEITLHEHLRKVREIR